MALQVTAANLYEALVAVSNEALNKLPADLQAQIDEACTRYEEDPAVREWYALSGSR